MSAENTASEVVQTILTSDKVAYASIGTTATAGLINHLGIIQSWLFAAATAASLLLTIILVVKHGLDLYRDLSK